MVDAWREARVYYYEEQKGRLVCDLIAPLLVELRAAARCCYFVRHWQCGPHLRLPICCSAEVFRERVQPRVEERVRPYLRASGSRRVMPPEAELRARYARLAQLEQVEGPLWPLVPDNTLLFTEHRPRQEPWGGPRGVEALAEFYQQSEPLAVEMLRVLESGESLDLLSAALMLAVAHRYGGNPPHLRLGFVSFRSHAEAFFWSEPSNSKYRGSFQQGYLKNDKTLQRLVLLVVGLVDGKAGWAGDPSPAATRPADAHSGRWGWLCSFVVRWVELLAPIWQQTESPDFPLPPVGAPLGAQPGESPGSPMHQLMASSAHFRQRVYEDRAFRRYRFLLNYTYLHLARLGLSGLGRYRLCHWVANAVEAALEVDAMQTVAQTAGLGAALPSASRASFAKPAGEGRSR